MTLIDELCQLFAAMLSTEGIAMTALPALTLYRREHDQMLDIDVEQLLLSLVVQGQKETTILNESYAYSAGSCFVSAISAPAVFNAVGSSSEKPFMGLALKLSLEDLFECAQSMPELKQESGDENAAMPESISIFEADEELLALFVRLFRQLNKDKPEPFINNLILKEIHYRLLAHPACANLRMLCQQSTDSAAVLKVVNYLKEHFNEPIMVDSLADMANMSSSAFYRKFRALTKVSPLQFQKQLRLQRALYLMREQAMSVNLAASEVGYESATQFSREFHRAYGKPPLQYIKYIKQTGARQ